MVNQQSKVVLSASHHIVIADVPRILHRITELRKINIMGMFNDQVEKVTTGKSMLGHCEPSHYSAEPKCCSDLRSLCFYTLILSSKIEYTPTKLEN